MTTDIPMIRPISAWWWECECGVEGMGGVPDARQHYLDNHQPKPVK